MSKRNILKFILAFVFIAGPVLIFAEEDIAAVVNYSLLPDSIEKLLELVNLTVALLVATYAIKLAALSQGGTMEKSWNMLAVAGALFALLEANNALAAFGLVHIGGLAEVIEIAFATVLLITVVRTRKFLLKQVLGK